MMPAMITAFTTTSSNATLPVNLECCTELGADKGVTSFVLPLGATINMDGTAIYQAVSAVFIASCYGMNLTFGQMAQIVLTAVLASIGTAGVSGAGPIMLAMVLAQIGVPVEGIALIIGVDKIFDMGRTTLNITGDATCAIWISRLEQRKAAKKAAKQA
jgi:Na+/H+-dicarboxylate symporter